MTDQAANPLAKEWQNLFGVCGCVAKDFGCDPLWLRLAFALPLIFNPLLVLSIYASLGMVVLATRLLFPDPKPLAAAPVAEATPGHEEAPLALAA